MSLASLCATHRVTFEEPIITLDTSGGQVRTWSEVEALTNIPCTIQPISARERVMYAQRQIMLTDRIYLNHLYNSSIKRTMRIKDLATNRYYTIQNWMDQAGRGLYTSLDVREFSD